MLNKDWIAEGKRLASSVSPYATGEATEELLWRTLIADLRQDFEPWSSVSGHTCLPGNAEYGYFFRLISGDFPWNADTPVWRREINVSDCRRRCKNFLAAFEKHGAGRVLFTTEGGLLGLGPKGMLAGDRISLIFGARVPFVLRKAEAGGWSLVGECYVRGIMHGEALEGKLAEKIDLV
ncbi:hypothetical protein BCR34DRAFT_644590 [Clohesyomyces aquaticus]|uniref:Heterokaryon incompatibility protein-domain-containing protein n=1 Tax=Clohesyomyces aquaticus TaxID=1231657 RepID=A0A1Y1ZYL6_9PLEO|nr:hypothetical protein BCR34DRAFT_644590 [Clohesyomyces aquaticus]